MATVTLGFAACSSDDDDADYAKLIIGTWENIANEDTSHGLKNVLIFKANGELITEAYDIDHGVIESQPFDTRSEMYVVNGDKLTSAENGSAAGAHTILKLDSKELTLRSPSGSEMTFQKVK